MRPDTVLSARRPRPRGPRCSASRAAWSPTLGRRRHGSLAREYGIPAVMGTGNATQRIASGRLVTVDGDAGTVTLLGSTGHCISGC
jgi:rifampicin phosphotransferase